MTLFWGVNFTAIKYSLEEMLPLSFNGLRFVIASFVILVAVRASSIDLRVPRGDMWQLFGFGVLANALYQSLFISGVARTKTGNAALIVSTTPLFTALIGRLRGHEQFSKRGVAGLLMAFAGIVMIILSGSSQVEFGQTMVGDCLLLAATLCWSLYTVGARRLIHAYGSLKATSIMMLSGTSVFMLVCAPSFISQDWRAIRPLAWGGLVYSSLLAIAIAHFIWNYAVRSIGSTRTAIYSNVTPVVAMIVAWFALGERVTPVQIIGAVITFIGLYLVRSGMVAVAPDIEEEDSQSSLGPGKN
jgi:drug/metabolite transporter (DMT)-like permease